MSTIIEAIDAEISNVEQEHNELRDRLTAAELRISGLRELREGAVSLNGGSPPASDPPKPRQQRKRRAKSSTAKPKDKAVDELRSAGSPAERRKIVKRVESEIEEKLGGGGTPTDEEREQRTAVASERQADVLAFVKENGEINADQAAELLGISKATARTFLRNMASHGRTALRSYEVEPETPRRGRKPIVYRLEMAPADDSGAKTNVERRVLDEVRKNAPIDEGTLAFNASLSLTDLRSVVAGLVRRKVLKRWEEEGTTLFGVREVVL